MYATDNQLSGGIVLVSGDVNNNNILEVGEVWIYRATGTAQAGVYNNTGTVTSKYVDSEGRTSTPTSTDPSSYFGSPAGMSVKLCAALDFF